MSEVVLKGIGVSGFDVEAEAIVVKRKDFSKLKTSDVKGKILVTGDSSPELTPLFLLIKGVVTENGAILSHAAIVSREFDTSCIIGVNHATEKIKTGDKVRLVISEGKVVVKK